MNAAQIEKYIIHHEAQFRTELDIAHIYMAGDILSPDAARCEGNAARHAIILGELRYQLATERRRNSAMADWTDDRIDLLTKRWNQGRNASDIAAELGGVTRNAVIGKAHRLGLQRHKKAAK